MSERIFIHLEVGRLVYVNGCPGRITAVSSEAWGCAVTILVNGSEGTYHPSDFLNGIITLVPPQEAITHGQ